MTTRKDFSFKHSLHHVLASAISWGGKAPGQQDHHNENNIDLLNKALCLILVR